MIGEAYIERRVILGLILLVLGLAAVAYGEHAKIKSLEADQQALHDAAALAEQYRKALGQCEADKAAVRKQQQDAEAAAAAAQAKADQAAEDFQRRLEQSRASILTAKVPPELMDY